jgi:hypothetical protein
MPALRRSSFIRSLKSRFGQIIVNPATALVGPGGRTPKRSPFFAEPANFRVTLEDYLDRISRAKQ